MNNNNVSTLITSTLIQHVMEQGQEEELLFEITDYSPKHLSQPDRYVPNETLIILLAQARLLLADPRTAYRVGRRAVLNLLGPDIRQILHLIPESDEIKNLIEQSFRKLLPLVSIRINVENGHRIRVAVGKKFDYLHTHDHCLLILGILEGLIEISGGVLQAVEEQSCLVPIDRAGEIDGVTFRTDDEKNVWQQDWDNEHQEMKECLAGHLSADDTFAVHSKAYGAGCCSYQVQWSDPRSGPGRLWSKTGGRIKQFAKTLIILDRNPGLDNESYRRITEEWKRWAGWESNYALTKAKYLSYLGILCLGSLPVVGRFYDRLGLANYQALLTILLSGLIFILGFSIVEIQMHNARKILKQNQDSQKFLQFAGVGVTMIRPDFTIEYANPLINDVFGEVTGRKCYEAFRWETEPCAGCAYQEALAGCPHARSEVEYNNKDGQKRWYHVTATPVLDAKDQVASVIKVSTDITDRKLLELELSRKQAELESSEDRYRSFMANAADAILITDPSHTIIEVNKKAAKFIGEDEISAYQGKNLFKTQLLPEEERYRIRKLFQEMIQNQSPLSFETRIQCADGHVLEIEARSIPILKGGKVEWVQSILRDVTERKHQEFEKSLLLFISNAIKDAPDLEAMIEQALSGICAVMKVPMGAIFLRETVDAGVNHAPTLRLAAQVGMSPQATRKLAQMALDGSVSGLASRSAVLKRTIVINDIDQVKADARTKRRIKKMGITSIAGIPMLMENEIQGVIYIASGKADPALAGFDSKRLATINHVANELAVGIAKQRLRDVINRKNQELIDKNQELENATIQLLQSEKMASIGQLAAGVAHEINNPIGYINSNLHLLNEYREDMNRIIAAYKDLRCACENADTGPEIRRLLDRLQELEQGIKPEQILADLKDMVSESIEGTERVASIVRNLKEFSHPNMGAPELADIHECLENTVNIVWNELKYKAKVIKEYQEIPPFPCYPQELKQVFMNLLVNAAQAIESRGEIKIRTFLKDESVNVEIEDSGVGIHPEQIKKIFDPFFTTKEVGKGTGLGLSISYSIVKKHNGEIKVESTPGQGSKFTVMLPIKGALADQPNQITKQEAGGQNERDYQHPAQ